MRSDSINKSSGSYLEKSGVKPNHAQYINSSTATFDASDIGSDHILNVDCVITLPATSAGAVFTCIAGADDVEITLSPNASGKEGDCVQVIGDGSAGWYVSYLSSKGNVSIES
jgi:hypothetical protein